MTDSPLAHVLMLAASIYLAKLWRDDLAANRAGEPNPRALPGATPAPLNASIIGAIGALALLAIETLGENALGLSEQQSNITVLFGIYTLAAPIIEEIIFRGYLVINGKGKVALWAGAVGASVLFAVLHPFLWKWDEHFELTLNGKGWFSTGILFASSLWFYTARLASWNPQRSLLPCFVAHAAKNAGVFAIKAAQGHVVGLW